MITFVLAALAVTTTKPATIPPNPCTPAESCRYVEAFSVRDGQGVNHRVTVGQWVPFIVGGHLDVFPGEVVSVQLSDGSPVVTASTFMQDDDHDTALEERLSNDPRKLQLLNGPRATNSPLDAGKDSLRIAFMQVASRTDMLLRISSGFSHTVIYKAAVIGPGTKTPFGVPVCPLRPTKIALEGWPGPLLRIELSEFRLTDAVAEDVSPQDCS